LSAAGDIKLTKDGDVLLQEMQIQNPTAMMIARTALAQDGITGDGTTSIVLYIGELLKQAEWYLSEGTHARVLTEGWEVARKATLELLETFKIPINIEDRTLIKKVAHTSICTKISGNLANQLTEIVVEAVLSVRGDGNEPIDLFMVEIMHMKHKFASDSRLIKGLVLDHGSRHPDMPKRAKNCFILNCNISLEYEKSEINSCYLHTTTNQKEKLALMEREVVDSRVRAIIDLKRTVCLTSNQSFMLINQKGIDPKSLDMLAREGIIGLRRAKRRNAERLQQSCGSYLVNSIEELSPQCLGFAGSVIEHTLGDEKYTFLEEVKNARSVTILVTAYSELDISQIKDAVRDGLRSVKNVIDDKCVVLGGGTFEVAASLNLMNKIRQVVNGKAKLGVDSFAQALMGIPKILAENAGFDPQEVAINLLHKHEIGQIMGLDITTGDPADLRHTGIYDNYNVKKQILLSAPIISSQLLLVDEIIRSRPDLKEINE
jgi:T-complex protein 1 subunit zeta